MASFFYVNENKQEAKPNIVLLLALIISFCLHLLLLIIPVSKQETEKLTKSKQILRKLDLKIVSDYKIKNKKNTIQKPKTRLKKKLHKEQKPSPFSQENILSSVRENSFKQESNSPKNNFLNEGRNSKFYKASTGLLRNVRLKSGSRVEYQETENGRTYVILLGRNGKKTCFVVDQDQAFKELEENMWKFVHC